MHPGRGADLQLDEGHPLRPGSDQTTRARRALLRPCGAALAAASALACLPREAAAHVKWFAAYNVAAPPAALPEVLSGTFIAVLALSALLMAVCFIYDGLAADSGFEERIDQMFEPLKGRGPDILRVSLGAFFLCLWLLGGILLTPELKTGSEAISWFQLLLALSTIWWRTTFVAAIGVVVLYGMAVLNYGIFHLIDYPIFLGIAAYLTIHSLDLTRLKPYALSILYAAIAQTLLWASIEKWAYASWTLPLLMQHQDITLGIDHRVYVMLAGFVEFVAAFLLLFGRLSQRLASAMLLGIFLAAIVDFGKIDAVGHLMIIVSLLVMTIEGNTIVNRAVQGRIQSLAIGGLRLAATYIGFILLFFLMYYGTHGLIFGGLA